MFFDAGYGIGGSAMLQLFVSGGSADLLQRVFSPLRVCRRRW